MTETVRIGGFEPGDGASIVDLWNRCLPEDPITPGRFRNLILLDPNFDSSGLRVARADGEIAGAAYAVRRLNGLEPGRGWLLFFFVNPAYRGRGLGTELVTDVLNWLGGAEVHFSPYTPNYVLPGLDREAYPEAARLLQRLGFSTRYQAIAMQRSLDDEGESAPQTAPGWYFGAPADDDLPELIALASNEFNPDWGRAIREAVAGGLPLERIVIARSPNGELAGWAMHGTYEGEVSRFGPFGVRESQRGHGLGWALLHLALERMRRAGADRAWFLWTTEDSAAARLYLNAGFSITRRFDVMSRVKAGSGRFGSPPIPSPVWGEAGSTGPSPGWSESTTD